MICDTSITMMWLVEFLRLTTRMCDDDKENHDMKRETKIQIKSNSLILNAFYDNNNHYHFNAHDEL